MSDSDDPLGTSDEPTTSGNAASPEGDSGGDSTDWKKRHDDLREFSRQQAEDLKSMNTSMATLEGRLEELSRSQHQQEDNSPQGDVFTPTEDEDWQDEVRNDPYKIIEFLRDEFYPQLASSVVDLHKHTSQRVEMMDARIGEMSPEKIAWRTKVEDFRGSDPAFADLPEEAVVALLKKQGAEPDYVYPGASGAARGGGNHGRRNESVSDEEKAELMETFMPLARGNRERAEKLVKKHIERMKGAA